MARLGDRSRGHPFLDCERDHSVRSGEPRHGSDMSAHQTMLSNLKSRRAGFSLPRDFYCDPAYYRLDLENLFYKEWLFAGHDCEIEKNGRVLHPADRRLQPVVVVRGNDGEIRAFHNSCRHRGSRICTTEHGKARRLVCPYHQWTYETRRLARARAPHGWRDRQVAVLGLKPVHCRSVGGYIFVCVGRGRARLGTLPFSTRGALSRAAQARRHVKVAVSNTIVENGNWKLVWENNRECYPLRRQPSRALPHLPRSTDRHRRPWGVMTRPGDAPPTGAAAKPSACRAPSS